MSYEFDITRIAASWPKIDLQNPQLGLELRNHPTGDLPVLVWIKYLYQQDKTKARLIWRWCRPPVDPVRQINPQKAVDQVLPLIEQILKRLPSSAEADTVCPTAWVSSNAWAAYDILERAATSNRRKRGQPPCIRHVAVRAYIIKKFNPDLSWAKLADLLFVENGTCKHRVKAEDAMRVSHAICGLKRHQYDSPCVKALRTAVRRLAADMNAEGISS